MSAASLLDAAGTGSVVGATVAAEVALSVPTRGTFHYAGPPELADLVRRGSVVAVPFSRRVLTGYVLGCGPPPADADYELKPIAEVLLPGSAIGLSS